MTLGYRHQLQSLAKVDQKRRRSCFKLHCFSRPMPLRASVLLKGPRVVEANQKDKFNSDQKNEVCSDQKEVFSFNQKDKVTSDQKDKFSFNQKEEFNSDQKLEQKGFFFPSLSCICNFAGYDRLQISLHICSGLALCLFFVHLYFISLLYLL